MSRFYALPLLLCLIFIAAIGNCASPIEEIADRARIHQGRNGVYILEKGEESLLARAWLTEKATRSIDAQYFIWSTDNIGTLSSEALLRAAQRGVQVRIIVDDLLIDAEPETLLSLAAHPNIHIRIYNPMHSVGVSFWERMWYLVTDFRAFNQRMHDKSAIYDETVAITGGRNMADEYYDYDQEYNFRDRDVLLAGPAVQDVGDSFERFWKDKRTVPLQSLLTEEQERMRPEQPSKYWNWLHAYAKNKRNFAPEVRTALEEMKHSFPILIDAMTWTEVFFISDLPGKNDRKSGLEGGGVTTSRLFDLVKKSKQRITIQSPYLVMPSGALEVFRKLIGRGVEIRVATNSLGSTDNLQAFSGYHKQRASLLDAGIEIYEFKPDAEIAKQLISRSVSNSRQLPVFALHAKSMVIDGKVAYVGTFNFDPRSANLNTEVGVLIYDQQLSSQIERAVEEDMRPENSWRAGVGDPDSSADILKRLKLYFWRLFPLEPLL